MMMKLLLLLIAVVAVVVVDMCLLVIVISKWYMSIIVSLVTIVRWIRRIVKIASVHTNTIIGVYGR